MPCSTFSTRGPISVMMPSTIYHDAQPSTNNQQTISTNSHDNDVELSQLPAAEPTNLPLKPPLEAVKGSSPSMALSTEPTAAHDTTVPLTTATNAPSTLTTDPANASAQEVSLSTFNASTIPPTQSEAPQSTLSRLDSIAIGPSTDTTPTVPVSSDNPTCIITLLLTSGARHPYKLDEKYLTKRNVNVPGVTEAGKKDPFSISVYTLKELILREWREEWEAKPTSPGSIRLIHFGRLLDDKTPLKECRFNMDTPNVVHMTVKPQDIVDDEEAIRGKTGTRDRDQQESTPGCRCTIL